MPGMLGAEAISRVSPAFRRLTSLIGGRDLPVVDLNDAKAVPKGGR